MENHVINDVHIRDYLLGRLDAEPELVEQIDERVLTDAEFSIDVDVVEDEILEEYIEGSLSADDLQAVERHFLRPPERQLKLRNARLLIHSLATGSRPEESKGRVRTPLTFFLTVRGIYKLPEIRTYAELAAAVLFAVSLLYLLHQRRELTHAVQESTRQLAEERQRNSAVNQQLQAAMAMLDSPNKIKISKNGQPADQGPLQYASSSSVLPMADASIVLLNLTSAGLRRGRSDLPGVRINTATQTLRVEVALASLKAGEYRVQLSQSGKAVWTYYNAHAAAVVGGSILKLDIPAGAFSAGLSELEVTQSGGRTTPYWFVVAKP